MYSKIYQLTGAKVVNLGTTQTNSFVLRNNNNAFNIKSISVAYRFINVANNNLIPEWETKTVYANCVVGGVNLQKIAHSFENFTDFAAITSNGFGFQITRSSQLFFESFFISNSIDFAIVCVNADAVINVGFVYDLIVEIQSIK